MLCSAMWRRDPQRKCEAYALPGEQACLAHASNAARGAFVARHGTGDDVAELCQRLEITAAVATAIAKLADVECGLDFTDSVFVDDADFERVEFRGPACFERVRFEHAAYFANATFECDVILRETEFCDDAHFEFVLFREDAHFLGARFGASAWFSGAAFASVADFRNCSVVGKAELVDVTFQGMASFDQGAFGDDVNLWGATFLSGTSFAFAAVEGRLDFWKARLSGAGTFTGFDLNGGVWFEEATIERELTFFGDETQTPAVVHLLKTEFGRGARITLGCWLDLSSVVVRQPLTIVGEGSHASMIAMVGCTLEAPLTVTDGVKFTACRFVRTTGLVNLRVTGDPQWLYFQGRRVVADELIYWVNTIGSTPARRVARLSRLDEGAPAPTPREVEAVYRQLRLAPDTTHAAAANDFHFGEMEMRRRGAEPFSAERVLLLLYRLIAGYGMRAWRAITAYAVVIGLVAMVMRVQGNWFWRGCASDQCEQAVGGGLHTDRIGDLVALAVRSSAQITANVDTASLRPLAIGVLVGLRVVGFCCFALAALAVRTRVRRPPWSVPEAAAAVTGTAAGPAKRNAGGRGRSRPHERLPQPV